MKKILVLALSIGLIAPAIAQVAKKAPQTKETRKAPNITPEQYAQRKTDLVDRQVQLSSDQKSKVFEMYKSMAPQRIGAIGHDAKTLREVTQAEQENLLKILNTKQREVLKTIQLDQESKQLELQKNREAKRLKTETDVRKPLTEDLKSR